MPPVTVIMTLRPQTASDLARSALSVQQQTSPDWRLMIVHGGDPAVAAAAAALAAADDRVAGAVQLSDALAGATGPVCFLETGARYPADYLAAVTAAFADPAVRCTVAARRIEHGPRFALVADAPPARRPVASQVAVRPQDARLPPAEAVSGPGRRDLPDVAVITRFGAPAAAAAGPELTVLLEVSTATPPLSVREQAAGLAAAGLPVVVAVAGPMRAGRGVLARALGVPAAAVVGGADGAAARRAALALVGTPMVCFLPAGWEADPAHLLELAGALSDPGVEAAVPVALDAGGSILGAGLIWADGRSIPQRLLAGQPYADAAGRVVDLPSAHAEGLTMRTADARAAIGRASAAGPWWAVQMTAGRVVLLGGATVAVPRFAPPAATALPVLPAPAAQEVLGAAPAEAVARSRAALAALGWRAAAVQPSDGQHWRAILERPGTVTASPVPARRWALKIGAPAGRRGDPWGDVFFADDLAAALRQLGNDVVIDRDGSAGRAGAYLDRVVLNLRGYQVLPRQPGAVNLLWIISHPDDVPAAEMRTYDKVYAASASWPAVVQREHGVAVQSLLQATNPQRFRPDAAVPDTGPDLLFVGNSRHQFRPIVADCRAAGLAPTVIGRDWEKFLPPAEIAAISVPNAELPAAYRSAGIVLNDHWGDMVSHGFLNNRLFDAVASGARVVSDDVPGLAEVFGDAVAVYRTSADLARLCDPAHRAALGSPQQRLSRAARIAEEHSFLARAKRLVADAATVEVLPG